MISIKETCCYDALENLIFKTICLNKGIQFNTLGRRACVTFMALLRE